MSDKPSLWHGQSQPEHGAWTMDLATTLTLKSLNTAIGTLTACGIVGTFTLDPMTGIFFPIVSAYSIPYDWSTFPPFVHDRRTSPGFTQPFQCSPTIDPHYGESGPPTNQDTHCTPFNPFYPIWLRIYNC